MLVSSIPDSDSAFWEAAPRMSPPLRPSRAAGHLKALAQFLRPRRWVYLTLAVSTQKTGIVALSAEDKEVGLLGV